MLFNGIFPFFGTFLFAYDGILALDISILILLLLTWGVFGRKRWAWWGTVVYHILMTVSTTITFWPESLNAILDGMRFPEFERGLLQNVPLQGFHLALFFVMPLTLTLLPVFISRRHFLNSK